MKLLKTYLIPWYTGDPEVNGHYLVFKEIFSKHFPIQMEWDGGNWKSTEDDHSVHVCKAVDCWTPMLKSPL